MLWASIQKINYLLIKYFAIFALLDDSTIEFHCFCFAQCR